MKRRTKRRRQSAAISEFAEQACELAGDQKFGEAVSCLRRALGIANASEPADAIRECATLLERIAEQQPSWGNGQYALGCAYERLRDRDRTREHLARALALEPRRTAPVYAILARMLWAEEKWTEALAETEIALAANSGNMLAHSIRSRCYSAIGRMAEAVECNRRALAACANRDVHSFMLFEMNFCAETTPEALYAEACRWNDLYAAPLAGRIRPHTNSRDPKRRLKIGYVSPDLYQHAIVKYLPGTLERHDPDQVETYLYSVGKKSDAFTDCVRRAAHCFRSMPGAGGEALAEAVRADSIDILVDLAGHTMGPAYLAFAEKPAPVQVTWLGALSTTGMRTIDYFLGDQHIPCPGTEHLFSEQVYRLPRICCSYRPFERVPVVPSPCLERGAITFGCFNSPRKLTRPVISVWSAILHLVPGSRLMLKYREMETQLVQDYFRRQFAEDGIGGERLVFAGPSPAPEYMQTYGEIDIALDPFPYNGGTTSVDTLFMGVPLVTLRGRLAVQQAGALRCWMRLACPI